MSRRGALWIVWGDGMEAPLERSTASLRRQHPELEVHVERLPAGATLLDKAGMMQLTPFDETVYLDADTVVLGRLDHAFERAARIGLACGICECPWARRYAGISDDTVEYNTGVLFFTERARPVFDLWARRVGEVDSSIRFFHEGELRTMPHNDQAGFAQAVVESGFVPFVLPHNWNFRPQWHRSWWGPIKIWHDYRHVPDTIEQWNANQSAADATIQYNELR